MQTSYLLLIALVLLLIALAANHRRRAAVIRHIQNKKTKKEREQMKELAESFIGKECVVYTMMGSEGIVKGTLEAVTDGALLMACEDSREAINLEYVVRIRDWPRNAKGKKKSIF